MAIDVWETSRSGTTDYADGGATRTLEFALQTTYDPDTAESYFLGAAPVLITGIGFRKSYTVKPVGGGCWEASFKYSAGRRQVPGDGVKWNFDTGGGSTHVEHSLETMGAYVPKGAEVTDFHNLVGVTKDTVQGCDVTIPALTLKGTIVLPYQYVTPSWLVQQAYLTGTVNASPWKGFAAGEVLNLGAAGGLRGTASEESEADWEVTWALACGPNISGLTIGEITGIQKRAWDYLWKYYALDAGGAGKFMTQKPLQVNVERLYQNGDFGLIPI
jgi:hypothetical protein